MGTEFSYMVLTQAAEGISDFQWVQIIATWIVPGLLALMGAYSGVKIALAKVEQQVSVLRGDVTEVEKELSKLEGSCDQQIEKLTQILTDHEKRMVRTETVQRICAACPPMRDIENAVGGDEQ
jgi:hypothetical protein